MPLKNGRAPLSVSIQLVDTTRVLSIRFAAVGALLQSVIFIIFVFYFSFLLSYMETLMLDFIVQVCWSFTIRTSTHETGSDSFLVLLRLELMLLLYGCRIAALVKLVKNDVVATRHALPLLLSCCRCSHPA